MRGTDLFLPNFCHIRSVFLLVLSGQLLAFVLVLVTPGGDPWQTLGLLSLFVQWIVLASAALLCTLRPLLARGGNVGAAVASYGLILVVTAIVSGIGASLLDTANDGVDTDFMLRSVAIAAIVAAVILRYLYVAHEWRRRLESEAAARVDALQARIRPHFLFNSLNTIVSMISESPAKAEAAVEDLADLFRASLAGSGRLVPLSEELALSEGYLRMEQLRLGERLRVRWEVAALPGDALLPPLSLQPLLENAVYHGIEPRVDGGVIEVTGTVAEGVLKISIVNPAAATKSAPVRQGSGMAVENIRERLRLALGRRAVLILAQRDDDYRVELQLPYKREHESSYR